MANVSLANVSKTFPGDVRAVDDVSLEIADGEFLVLVGPSGCGKSTLLRMIAGLEESTAGTIRVGDRDVTRVPPKDRDVAMVFQNYALYPHMTVADNMAFGLKLRGTPRDEIARRVNSAAELLGLGELTSRKPAALSGGQRQRVALGRAIVRDPAVFLFDEPLSNLDALLRIDTRRELAALHRRLDTTTIHVTHDQVEAMTLGTRVAVMRDGVVLQVGPPLEVYDRPVNTFVAGFLGSPPMNLLSPNALGSNDDPAATIGVRPEHMTLTVETGDTLDGIPAEVRSVQPLGNESHVELHLAGHAVIARVSPVDAPRPGTTVGVHVDPRHLHRFDAMGNRVPEPPR